LKITLELIEQWAYHTELDEHFEVLCDEDCEVFDRVIQSLCDLEKLLQFAADPKCLKRHYFATLLVPFLCWIYRANFSLPFAFSRLQGIMSRKEYIEKILQQAESIYKISELIDKLREINDPAIHALYNKLLDYRHDSNKTKNESYYEILKVINHDVLPLFNSE
jgi:hypothetical protein